MMNIQQHAQQVLESLQRTVQETLDRKRRLGEYAVVWKDGKIVRLFDEDDPAEKAD